MEIIHNVTREPRCALSCDVEIADVELTFEFNNQDTASAIMRTLDLKDFVFSYRGLSAQAVSALLDKVYEIRDSLKKKISFTKERNNYQNVVVYDNSRFYKSALARIHFIERHYLRKNHKYKAPPFFLFQPIDDNSWSPEPPT